MEGALSIDAADVPDEFTVERVEDEPGSSTTSCLCLGRANPLRLAAIKITEHSLFKKGVMWLIVTNCVLMATADYSPHCLTDNYVLKNNCWRNRVLEVSEPIFTAFYVLEMMLRVTALGLVTLPSLCDFRKKGWHRAWKESKKSGYLNEYWNVVDFVVVGSSIVELVGIGNVNLSFLRAIRALRPLRTMKSIQSMRQLVEMLLNSVLSVSHTLVFLGFVFIIWAILSVQMWGWNGRIHGRCRLTPFPIALSGNSSSSQNFSWPIDDGALAAAYETEGQSRRCVGWATKDPWTTPQPCAWPMAPNNGIVRLCGLPLDHLVDGSMSAPRARVCPAGQWCGSNYDRVGRPRFTDAKVMAADLFTADTNWGFNNYDHVFVASLSIFQTLSMGGWRRPVWQLQDCFDPTGSALYFTSLMVIGSFFLVKLVLAVMVSSYNHADREQLEEDQRQEAEAVFREVEKVMHGGRSRGYVMMKEVRAIVDQCKAKHKRNLLKLEADRIGSLVKKKKRAVGSAPDSVEEGGKRRKGALAVETLPKGILSRLLRVQKAGERIEASYPLSEEKFLKLMFDPLVLAQAEAEKEAKATEEGSKTEKGGADAGAGGGEELGDLEAALDMEASASGQRPRPQSRFAKPLLPCLQCVVHHYLFERLMLMLILANTAVLCADRYPQTKTEQAMWAACGEIFTFAFSIELVIKVLSLGTQAYAQDGFNVLDACLVGASWGELIVAEVSGISEQNGAFMALRTLRLLRIFKMLNKFKRLRTESYMVMRMLNKIGAFGMLLFIFVCTMALMGQQSLAHRMRFAADGYPVGLATNADGYSIPRTNFDTFSASVLAVMQILTGERWERVMFDSHRAIGIWGSLFCVTVVVSGQFIVLNIFVAILINSFNTIDSSIEDAGQLLDRITLVIYHRGQMRSVRVSKGALTNLPIFDSGTRWGESHACIVNFIFDKIEEAGGHNDLLWQREGGYGKDLDVNGGMRYKIYVLPHLRREAVAAHFLELEDGTEMVLTGPESVTRWRPLEHMSDEKRRALGDEQAEAASKIQSRFRGNNVRGNNARSEDKGGGSSGFDAAMELPSAYGGAAGGAKGAAGGGKGAAGGGKRGCSWRARIQGLVNATAFDRAVLTVIIVSCGLMALDNPLADPSSRLNAMLFACEGVIVMFFVAEMILKLLADGPCKYFANGWNVMDFIITLSSILGLGLAWIERGGGTGHGHTLADQLSALRPLRVLRCLRPLRMLTHNENMRVVVKALLNSFVAVGPLLLIIIIFFLSIAIVSVRFLKGRFFACKGPEFDSLSDAQHSLVTYPMAHAKLTAEQQGWAAGAYTGEDSKAVCEWLGASWQHTLPYNFDNVLQGMGALLMICTTEDWELVMYTAMDSRAIGMQPIEGSSMIWAPFFILVMIVGSFFLLRLFVAVVIQHYKATLKDDKVENGEHAHLTAEQARWIRMQQKMLNIAAQAQAQFKPPSWCCPLNRIAYEIAYGAGASLTSTVVYSCIILNTVLMASLHFGQSEGFANAISTCNQLFVFIFMAELLFKLLAIGPLFFDDGWNNFDFVVGITGFAALGYKYHTGKEYGGAAMSILRVLRLGRMLRLMRHNKELQAIMNTILAALPPLANLSAVLILFYFMYAVTGVQLFAKVRLVNMVGRHLNDGWRFQSFWGAWKSLLPSKKNMVMMEVANWQSIPCTDDPPYDPSVCGFDRPSSNASAAKFPSWDPTAPCTPIDGCGTWLAYPYFMSFYWFLSFIVLNLFTAVILLEFQKASAKAQEERKEDEREAAEKAGLESRDEMLMVGGTDSKEEDEVGLRLRDYECLCQEWAKQDPLFTWQVTRTQLLMVVAQLPPPLGFKNLKDSGVGCARIEEEFEMMLEMEYHDGDAATDTIIDHAKGKGHRAHAARAGTLAHRDVKHFHFRAVCAMLARRAVRIKSEMPLEEAKNKLSLMLDTGTALSVMVGRTLHSDNIVVPPDKQLIQRQQERIAELEAKLAEKSMALPIDPREHEAMWASAAAKRNGEADEEGGGLDLADEEGGGLEFGKISSEPVMGQKSRVHSKTRVREVLNQTKRTIV
jgi:hypothetical protein